MIRGFTLLLEVKRIADHLKVIFRKPEQVGNWRKYENNPIEEAVIISKQILRQ